MNKHETTHLPKEAGDIIKGAKAARDVARKFPYLAMGIALGVGTFIGLYWLKACRKSA